MMFGRICPKAFGYAEENGGNKMAGIFETIVAGVTVFVAGQILLKLVVEPVQQLKRTIGEIAHALEFYANVFSNPGVGSLESQLEASRKLRSLSAQLSADLRVIPAYSVMRCLFFLPPMQGMIEVRRNLIGISNGVFRNTHGKVPFWNIKKAQLISDALGIFIPAHERITDDLLDELGGLKAKSGNSG